MSVDKAEVENLRKVYNREHPQEPPIPSGSIESVWGALKTRFHSTCSQGAPSCIITSMLVKGKAPDTWKENRHEWLSSDDIDAVERSYVDLFEDYEFLGCVPMDFDLKSETQQCLVSTLCSLKIDKLAKKGKHRFGIAVNTDVHDGPGEHWVGVFCDIRPELEYPRMTYFDSYAMTPEPEIKKLMNRWAKQWDATKTHTQPMKLTYNTTRHQFKDSECGMYVLYFHLSCLLENEMGTSVPDEVVNAFRDLLFKIPRKGT